MRNSNISNRSSPILLRLFPEIGGGKHEATEFYARWLGQIVAANCLPAGDQIGIVRPLHPSLHRARIGRPYGLTQPALNLQPPYNIGPTPARFRCTRCIVLKSGLQPGHIDRSRSRPMTTLRHAACNCGRVYLTIEGEPSRIAMCHCLACQRRTGAVISNQARSRREQVAITGNSTTWLRIAESGNALTITSVRHVAPPSTGGTRAFLDTSTLPSATSPIQVSPHQTSRCGRSHATPGSPCPPTRRPSAWRSRDDKQA